MRSRRRSTRSRNHQTSLRERACVRFGHPPGGLPHARPLRTCCWPRPTSPYDIVLEMTINEDFLKPSMVIGANDIVNPAAHDDPAARSPACRCSRCGSRQDHHRDEARMASGYAGVDNPLFCTREQPHAFGDAKKMSGRVAARTAERRLLHSNGRWRSASVAFRAQMQYIKSLRLPTPAVSHCRLALKPHLRTQ